jgi:hypothetical protein
MNCKAELILLSYNMGNFEINHLIYLGPMLPPGGRNWQLIYPHSVDNRNFKMLHTSF